MPPRSIAVLSASLLAAACALAQTPAQQPPAWDVISVRPVDLQKCTNGSGMRTLTDGVNIFCLPLLPLIEQAYGITQPNRIVGTPTWAKTTFYNIDAKVSGDDVAAYNKLSTGDKNRMVQLLLADRFHLKAHTEQRELPIFDLVVAKGGHKLKDATPDEAGRSRMGMHPGKLNAVAMPLSYLPDFLNPELGRTVVDKTGLTGKYDFTLEYVPANQAATDTTGGPSIFTAIEEQLGLKLEPAKAMMDVLVVDSIDQPSAN